jgi:hypothetical protein
MEPEWLAKFESPRADDRYFSTTPVSAHDPRVTGEEVRGQFSLCVILRHVVCVGEKG